MADIVAQKLHVEPSEPEEDVNLSIIANLTRVSPEVWKELPRDVQEVIIKARMEENKSKGREERVKDSNPKPDSNLPRQYSNPKANLTTTTPNEGMVEEYL